MDFEAITTQEAFDAAIKDRLERQKKADAEKYEGYISPTDHQAALDALNKKLADQKSLEERLHAIETENGILKVETTKRKIADELGLDSKWVSRIKGTDEETIRKDAQILMDMMPKPTTPQANPETMPSGDDDEDAAYKKLLAKLKGE